MAAHGALIHQLLMEANASRRLQRVLKRQQKPQLTPKKDNMKATPREIIKYSQGPRAQAEKLHKAQYQLQTQKKELKSTKRFSIKEKPQSKDDMTFSYKKNLLK